MVICQVTHTMIQKHNISMRFVVMIGVLLLSYGRYDFGYPHVNIYPAVSLAEDYYYDHVIQFPVANLHV